MRIKRIHLAPVALLSLAGLTAQLPAADIYAWDFQDNTPGATLSGTGIDTSGLTDGNAVTVVDNSTTPPDPFGGTGNQSAYIHFASGSSGTPTAQFNIPGYTPPEPLTSGKVTFSIDLQTAAYMRGAIEIDLGTMYTTGSVGREASLAAVQINYSNSGSRQLGGISYFENTTSGSNITSSTYAISETGPSSVSISWDTATGQYSIWLDDTIIITSDFTVPSVEGVNAIRFSTVNGASDIGFFIDDLTVSQIPESSSVGALLGVLTLSALLFARRRRR